MRVLHSLHVLLLLFAATAPGEDPGKPPKVKLEQATADITGIYTCAGVESGGKKYSGLCTIQRRGDTFIVTWLTGGGAVFSGVGIRQNDTFAVSWTMPTEKGIVRGINLYRVEPSSAGPRLTGRWATLPGSGALQSETLTFVKDLPSEEDE